MSIETNHRSHETVWTLQRVISVAASLVMISALGIISYNIGDLVPVATATTPTPGECQRARTHVRAGRDGRATRVD